VMKVSIGSTTGSVYIHVEIITEEDGFRVYCAALPEWSTWVRGDKDRAISIGLARIMEKIATDIRAEQSRKEG
jgi:hypothetical protein